MCHCGQCVRDFSPHRKKHIKSSRFSLFASEVIAPAASACPAIVRLRSCGKSSVSSTKGGQEEATAERAQPGSNRQGSRRRRDREQGRGMTCRRGEKKHCTWRSIRVFSTVSSIMNLTKRRVWIITQVRSIKEELIADFSTRRTPLNQDRFGLTQTVDAVDGLIFNSLNNITQLQ